MHSRWKITACEMDKNYTGCIKGTKGILRTMSQISPKSFKTLTIAALIGGMILSACGDKAPDMSDTLERMESEQNVGTDTSVVVSAEQVPPIDRATESQTSDQFKIDAAANRVYLPKTGWISVDEFWEIYMNHPDKLPADFDHAALDAIRPAESGG